MVRKQMKPIKKIVIVGGGSSGWISAAILANQFRRDVLEVELVESEDIGTIGVGESTIPPFVGLINNLGIDEQFPGLARQFCDHAHKLYSMLPAEPTHQVSHRIFSNDLWQHPQLRAR